MLKIASINDVVFEYKLQIFFIKKLIFLEKSAKMQKKHECKRCKKAVITANFIKMVINMVK